MRGENVGVGVLDEDGVLELLDPRKNDGVDENDAVEIEEIVLVVIGATMVKAWRLQLLMFMSHIHKKYSFGDKVVGKIYVRELAAETELVQEISSSVSVVIENWRGMGAPVALKE